MKYTSWRCLCFVLLLACGRRVVYHLRSLRAFPLAETAFRSAIVYGRSHWNDAELIRDRFNFGPIFEITHTQFMRFICVANGQRDVSCRRRVFIWKSQQWHIIRNVDLGILIAWLLLNATKNQVWNSGIGHERGTSPSWTHEFGDKKSQFCKISYRHQIAAIVIIAIWVRTNTNSFRLIAVVFGSGPTLGAPLLPKHSSFLEMQNCFVAWGHFTVLGKPIGRLNSRRLEKVTKCYKIASILPANRSVLHSHFEYNVVIPSERAALYVPSSCFGGFVAARMQRRRAKMIDIYLVISISERKFAVALENLSDSSEYNSAFSCFFLNAWNQSCIPLEMSE